MDWAQAKPLPAMKSPPPAFGTQHQVLAQVLFFQHKAAQYLYFAGADKQIFLASIILAHSYFCLWNGVTGDCVLRKLEALEETELLMQTCLLYAEKLRTKLGMSPSCLSGREILLLLV